MSWAQAGAAVIGAGLQFAGARSANNATRDIANQNANLQREFALKGIRWRVEDAKAAGIHPLYALGASVPTYSPVSASFNNPAAGFASVGQNIGRAIDATRTQKERSDEEAEMAFYARQRAKLENDLIREQINATRRTANPPLPASDGDPSSAESVVGRSNSATAYTPDSEVPWWRISSGMKGGDVEEEYGEAAGSLYGLGKFGYDGIVNGYRQSRNAIRDIRTRVKKNSRPERRQWYRELPRLGGSKYRR